MADATALHGSNQQYVYNMHNMHSFHCPSSAFMMASGSLHQQQMGYNRYSDLFPSRCVNMDQPLESIAKSSFLTVLTLSLSLPLPNNKYKKCRWVQQTRI